MNGWHHITEDDSDRDRDATTHFAVRGAERLPLPWSPFKPYTAEHFRRYLALGFPTVASGNVFPDEIDELWAARPRRRDISSFITADLDHVLQVRRPQTIIEMGI
jgi:hypothetical protein